MPRIIASYRQLKIKEEHLEDQLQLLLSFHDILAEEKSLPGLLCVLLQKIIHTFGVSAAGVFDYRDEGPFVKYTSLSAANAGQIEPLPLREILIEHTPLKEIVSWNDVRLVTRPKWLAAYDAKQSLFPDVFLYEKALYLPLYCDGKHVGRLILYASDNVFDNYSDSFWRLLAAQVSSALSGMLSESAAILLKEHEHEARLKEIEDHRQQLEVEKHYLQEEIGTVYNYAEIVGTSAAMQKVFRLVSQVANSASTVLILGETGTGKELIARAIHMNSPRKDKLMVKVNCATLPANLIESELFGHERGSFTGATERRIGKFELANNATLFLDEIGELPPELQVKLLRALQEKEIERIGGKGTIKVDVRIITATNRDLQKEVNAGRFRSDLFYRLDVFPITLPPLRERKEDLAAIALHFVTRYCRKMGKEIKQLSQKVLQDMMAYSWPGNIRELEHLIERSVLLTPGNMIKQVQLPKAERTGKESSVEEEARVKSIDENEREHILSVLKKVGGRVSGPGGAAELLQVPSTTLNSKMKRLGISREHVSQQEP